MQEVISVDFLFVFIYSIIPSQVTKTRLKHFVKTVHSFLSPTAQPLLI